MALINYREPCLVGTGAIKEPRQVGPGAVAQNAFWRRGSVLINKTVGTIVNPNPTGALFTAAGSYGPAAAAVVLATSASAGAPQQTYYVAATYTAAAQESVPYFGIINCPAGFLPSINVLAAGAPAGATNFAAYMGTVPGYLALQQATKTTTALGTPFVGTNPLTNNIGWAQAVTGTATNIVGIALTDYQSTYFDGTGGSGLAGSPISRLGASVNIPPLSPFESPGLYALGLGLSQQVEMNLVNTTAYYPNLNNTAIGLTLDATTGFFVADPGQAAVGYIVGQRDGVYIGPTADGTIGDLGARVIVAFNAGVLALT